jgi:hypothetical protein
MTGQTGHVEEMQGICSPEKGPLLREAGTNYHYRELSTYRGIPNCLTADKNAKWGRAAGGKCVCFLGANDENSRKRAESGERNAASTQKR